MARSQVILMWVASNSECTMVWPRVPGECRSVYCLTGHDSSKFQIAPSTEGVFRILINSMVNTKSEDIVPPESAGQVWDHDGPGHRGVVKVVAKTERGIYAQAEDNELYNHAVLNSGKITSPITVYTRHYIMCNTTTAVTMGFSVGRELCRS
jgi:hypothetical protein